MDRLNVKRYIELMRNYHGNFDRSLFKSDKKLLKIFNIIDGRSNDRVIDRQEMTKFANSIFSTDLNRDGNVNEAELSLNLNTFYGYKFSEQGISAKDLLNFMGVIEEAMSKKENMVYSKQESSLDMPEVGVDDMVVYIDDANMVATSAIRNQNYESEESYTKFINGDYITILDKKDNTKTVLDLKNMLSPLIKNYNREQKKQIMNVIKALPAEALIDLSIEATFGNESLMPNAVSAFNWVTDEMLFKNGVCNQSNMLHELGHAIDCVGRGNVSNFRTNSYTKFRDSFNEEMKDFIKDRNIRWTDECPGILIGSETENKSTYATYDEQEMFAECYVLLMQGSCVSQETIEKYFHKTLECAKEILFEIRKLSAEERH